MFLGRSEADWKEGTDVFYYMGNKDDAKVLSFIEKNPSRLNEKDAEGRRSVWNVIGI